MILPHPESDLNLNIMVLGADIIRMLSKKQDYVMVETLMHDFLKKDTKRSPDMFLNTLTFLYSFGILEHTNYKIKIVSHKPQQTSLF